MNEPQKRAIQELTFVSGHVIHKGLVVIVAEVDDLINR